jgi:alkylated DNA repair protein (DNA oxidative demethylase)
MPMIARQAGTDHVDGLGLLPGFLSRADQRHLLSLIVDVIGAAPLFTAVMPRSGRPFSVAMTNCGSIGWISDRQRGYRYESRHPRAGTPWPAIPDDLMAIWDAVAGYGAPPQACLVNYYAPGARMGLHVDADESARSAPVVSLSLGDTALFRIGGENRGDSTRSFKLSSGDIVVLGGAARHIYHGVDRIYPGTSSLLAAHADLFPHGGRINLTLRRVSDDPPAILA